VSVWLDTSDDAEEIDMIIRRYHDISAAHRLVGHLGKCRFIHGHNYRIYFHIEGDMDDLGMVVDFDTVKATLCKWLDDNWDHKLILWASDPLADALQPAITKYDTIGNIELVPFNPTAEGMAQYLLDEIGPRLLPPELKLVKVIVQETQKCSAEASTAAQENRK
jgi:6-pyruvoyltetrahydropterin/6-carboxytetrahydropterin synthase